MTDSCDHYLSVQQVMQLLQLSRLDVETMIRRGTIPHTRISGEAVRFSVQDMITWLRLRSVNATDALIANEMLKTVDRLEYQYSQMVRDYSAIPF